MNCMVSLFLVFFLAIQQTADEIEAKLAQLRETEENLQSQLEQVREQIARLRRQMAVLGIDKFEQEGALRAKTKIISSSGQIYHLLYPSLRPDDVIRIPGGDEVLVLGYDRNSREWRVEYSGVRGLLSDSALNEKDPSVAKALRALRLSGTSVEDGKRLMAIAKYGKDTADRLMRGEYWIGMTAEMVRGSLGKPDYVKWTVTANVRHEQWLYERQALHLYFENGKLTSWQGW